MIGWPEKRGGNIDRGPLAQRSQQLRRASRDVAHSCTDRDLPVATFNDMPCLLESLSTRTRAHGTRPSWRTDPPIIIEWLSWGPCAYLSGNWCVARQTPRFGLNWEPPRSLFVAPGLPE